VRVLVDTHNFRVIVQPSSLRIFSNDEYIKAGALVDEDLSEACLILGIKKMPLKTIQPGKSYMFFGHVIKAQKSNFDILDKLLNSKVTLTLHSC
jgi:alpha-aminoadipic semialdehyde synthase